MLRPRRRAAPPVPLDDAIRGVAACPCKAHQGSFVDALGAADQLILRLMDPTGAPSPPGEPVAEVDEPINVATAVDPEGRSFLHAFADLEAAESSFPGGRFVTVSPQAVFRMSLANGNEGLLVTAAGPEDTWAAVTAEGLARLLESP